MFCSFQEDVGALLFQENKIVGVLSTFLNRIGNPAAFTETIFYRGTFSYMLKYRKFHKTQTLPRKRARWNW